MATSSFQETLRTFHSRKLLSFLSFNQSSASTSTSTPTSTPTSTSSGEDSLGSNVVLILTVLICALICSHLMNAIIRCVLKCSSSVSSDDDFGNGRTSRPEKLANQGISKQALETFSVVSYSPDTKIPGLESECVICLEDFSPEEKIRILPKCNHGFHVKCIDKWLDCHSSCPTCRHCLLETCQKSVGCTSPLQPSTNASLPGRPREIVVRVPPLQPEGMIKVVIVS